MRSTTLLLTLALSLLPSVLSVAAAPVPGNPKQRTEDAAAKALASKLAAISKQINRLPTQPVVVKPTGRVIKNVKYVPANPKMKTVVKRWPPTDIATATTKKIKVVNPKAPTLPPIKIVPTPTKKPIFTIVANPKVKIAKTTKIPVKIYVPPKGYESTTHPGAPTGTNRPQKPTGTKRWWNQLW